MQHLDARPRATAAVVAALLVAAVAATPAGAATTTPGHGQAKLQISGKAALRMQAAGVTVAATRPARTARSRIGRTSARRTAIALPVAGGRVTARRATLRLRGKLQLTAHRRGAHRRTAAFRQLRLSIGARRATLSAVLGGKHGKRYALLTAKLARKRVALDRDAGTVRLATTRFSLTVRGAALLRTHLRLRKLRAGTFGTLRLRAHTQRKAMQPAPAPRGPSQPSHPAGPSGPAPAAPSSPTPPVDDAGTPPADPGPYPFCPIAAGTPSGSTPGAPAAPAPAPTLTDPIATTSATADWGLRQSFRTYVGHGNGEPPISTLDGASATADGTFHFTATSGAYQKATNAANDQAVLSAPGTVVFCYPAHSFWIAVSNPTVTIDGADSRITMDVDANEFGHHLGSHRADVAALDLSAVRPEYADGGRTITWRDVPATLTEDGSTAFAGFLSAGEELDPITITATIPQAPDPFAGSCAITDGEGPGTPGGPPGAPAPAPLLTSPLAVTRGATDWGFKSGFRTYVGFGNGTPPIAAIDGASTNADGTFHFPATRGQLEPGATPRAIVEGSGTAVFCYPAHFFRIAISNPTITIDGADSRITMDVDTNTFGTESGTARADVATLDLTGIAPESTDGGRTLTWHDVPATLTEDGATAFAGFYTAGTALDPITVTAGTPLD